MAILIFFIILSVLVLVHELGHFALAKWNGVEVEEFGFGLPPRLFGKRFKGTLYSINLLPFGGFVSMRGEDTQEYADKLTVAEHDPKNFISKTPFQKLQILLAGVVMNMLLAFLLYYVLFAFHSFASFRIPLLFDYQFRFGTQHNITTVVADIKPDTAAAAAGIKVGEAVLSVDGVAVSNVDEIRALLADKANQPVNIVVQDIISDSPERTITLSPKFDETGKPILGVLLTSATHVSYDSTLERILSGPLHAYNMSAYSLFAISNVVKQSFETHSTEPVSSSVAGPVGIYSIIKSILENTTGTRAVLSILDYTALMSLSLAVMNVLPFPALDGGRVFFVLLELIIRRRINPKYEIAIHKVGMLLLLTLLVLVSVKDILNIF